MLVHCLFASGSLPKLASHFIDAIREEIYGRCWHVLMASRMCLFVCLLYMHVGCMFTGAGGGGFIAVLTKGPASKTKIQEIVQSDKVKGHHHLWLRLLLDLLIYFVCPYDSKVHVMNNFLVGRDMTMNPDPTIP